MICGKTVLDLRAGATPHRFSGNQVVFERLDYYLLEKGRVFAAFPRMFRELPNIDAILLNPFHEPIPGNAAAQYAVASAWPAVPPIPTSIASAST